MRMMYDVLERVSSAPRTTQDVLTAGVREYLIAYTSAEPDTVIGRSTKEIYSDLLFAAISGMVDNDVSSFATAIMPDVSLSMDKVDGTNGFLSMVSNVFHHEHSDIPPGESAMIAKFEHELANKVGLVGSLMTIMPGEPVKMIGDDLKSLVVICT